MNETKPKCKAAHTQTAPAPSIVPLSFLPSFLFGSAPRMQFSVTRPPGEKDSSGAPRKLPSRSRSVAVRKRHFPKPKAANYKIK